MGNLLNSWQFYVILSIVCDVIFTQTYKLAVQHAKNDSAATMLLEIIATIGLLFLIPLFPFLIPTNPVLYIFLLLSCFVAGMQDRLKTTARKFLPASEAALLNEMTSVFIIIIGFLVFKQPFVIGKVIGALCIIGANILLMYRKGKFVVNKYTALMVIACTFLAIALSLDIGFSQNFNIPFYIAFTYLFSAITIKFITKTKFSDVKKEFVPKQRLYYILAGTSWSILAFSIIRAAQLGPIIVVIPLASLSVLFNVLTAMFVHKETNDLWRKLIAALIVIAGLFLTVWH